MLLTKFFNVGFEATEVHDRRLFGLESLTRYPLFTPEFIDLLRQTLPPERHDELVFSLVVTARRPALRAAPRRCGACRHDNPSDAPVLHPVRDAARRRARGRRAPRGRRAARSG